MAKLTYFMPTSLDGYIADDGNFDWSTPSEEAFAFIATTMDAAGFREITESLGLASGTRIFEVDESSLFCVIDAPRETLATG